MAKSSKRGMEERRPVPPKIGAKKWKALYEAAAKFHALDAWGRFYETDLFGVRSPVDGQLYFGQILGGAGEYFALHLYGGDGGAAYCAAMFGEVPADPYIAQFLVELLAIEFTSRAWMEPYDMKVRKTLGTLPKMTGYAPEFVSFRSQIPGCSPWFPDAEEADMMEIGLARAVEFVGRAGADERLLEDAEGDFVFQVFRCREGADPMLAESWEMAPEEFPFDSLDRFDGGGRDEDDGLGPREEMEAALEKMMAEGVDDVTSERLAALERRRGTRWEIGGTYLPQPIMEGERPFYPFAMVIADSASGRVLGNVLAKPSSDRMKLARRLFVDTAEAEGLIPPRVAVADPVMLIGILGILKKFGVETVADGGLDALEAALEALDAAARSGEF